MRRRGLLSSLPAITLAAFLAPVVAGLIGTWLPAFGFFPTLGGESLTLAPWRELFAQPGLAESLRLTLISGLLATLLAFLLTVFFLAACHGGRLILAVRGLMAPLIAVPHAAVALGLAFLLAPSGWLVRLVSPWATGWDLPPDVATVQDPNALALTLALVVKEVPFLLLMTLAALEQVRAEERLAVARSLGYGPLVAWLKAVLPAVYRQIRLPLYAVLAFSLSVVDMALILAPLTPPPLAVQVLRWFNDPDLSMRFVAAAGACLQLLIVVGAIALWRLGETAVALAGRAWIAGGQRGGDGRIARAVSAGLVQGLVILAAAGLAAVALWSVTGRWRFPDALPADVSLDTWARHAPEAAAITATTLVTGLVAAGIALMLVVGCLENEQRRGLTLSNRALWLLYAPLLVPQVAFLFGTQVLAIQAGIDATWIALVWSHLLFVLPYVFLTLADPYRALDERYARTALCLGAKPNRVFWQVKLPMLLRPMLFALAVGFAVSVAQYLPTLFAGGGRFVTLTTEAVGLAAGGDRRVMGVYAFLQALLPLLAFAAALALPRPLVLTRRLEAIPA
ncbi:ABC transporter permease [Pelagibius marinus]|uniref:ABC transporter permease n=1 Tax=Pelagibius marinus TaxID=2762760 RepID=UPI001D04ABCC|nr:ABC transporter permease subunit [Pelagibius marinus]